MFFKSSMIKQICDVLLTLQLLTKIINKTHELDIKFFQVKHWP